MMKMMLSRPQLIRSNQDDIVEVGYLEIEDALDDVDVPFAIIEDVPLFPGCEKLQSQKEEIISRNR
jgi:hypothetical protein|tara:strand:+ start:516 stop:713 length:198 start_codon:yes stop_codon:yes gene_type:complete